MGVDDMVWYEVVWVWSWQCNLVITVAIVACRWAIGAYGW